MDKVDAPIRQKVFHDAHLWLILFTFFLAITLKIHWYTVVAWAVLLCIVGLIQGVNIRFAVKALFLASTLSISIWLLNAMFHADNVTQEQAYIKANEVALKVWSMTWVALLSSKMINIRDIIAYLLQRGWLSTQIAYAMMAGIGSIDLMRAEAKRISLNAMLRGLTWRERFLQWIPLLVFALRHAQRGAMSLRARGLSAHKSFYYNYQSTTEQKITASILIICFVIITFVSEYVLIL